MGDSLDFALISDDKGIVDSIRMLCQHFNYSLEVWKNEDDFFDQQTAGNEEGGASGPTVEPLLILVSALNTPTHESVTQKVQVAKQVYPKSFLGCVVAQKMPKEEASFIQKSGANIVFLENEIYNSSKLEYVCSNIIREMFIPVKLADFEQERILPFDIYYYAPQRSKYLICGHETLVLSDEKMAKMKKYGDFFIKRQDINKFNNYIKSERFQSTASLEKRCRFQYLNLCWNYAEFVFLLTDYSRYNSLQEGKALFDNCKEISNSLINSLVAVDDLWQVINQKTIEGMILHHVPAITAYAGLFALKMGMDSTKVTDVMLATMLGDVGMIYLPPSLTKKLRSGKVSALTPEELQLYQKHPADSLKVALDRRLPISPKVRDYIVDAHERADGSGFPRGRTGDKLSQEVFLVIFAEEYHIKSMQKIGQEKMLMNEFNAKLLDDPSMMLRYRPTFVNELRNLLLHDE
ncbi:MAG: hypothetical protein HQK53_19510 [Oligoflexia bacterium]|nr:hypothetical protein [Oligoflexia bacterium]